MPAHHSTLLLHSTPSLSPTPRLPPLAPSQVHRKPHVAVMSTGDEVCEPDAPALGPGQVRDANRAMLLAAAAATGAAVTDVGIARDSAAVVEAALDAALAAGADVLLTTGEEIHVARGAAGGAGGTGWLQEPLFCLIFCCWHHSALL